MRAQRLLRWVSLFLIGAFGLLALDSLHLVGSSAEAGRAVIAPFAWAASIVADEATGAWATIGAIGELNQRDEKLRAENAQLTAQNQQLEALGRENASLRQLLSFKETHPTFTYHPASIIARGTNNLQPMLTLDQGSADGLQVGMSVVDPGGLLGRITRLGAHVATVLPVDNPASAVAAYVNAESGTPTGMVRYEPGAGLILDFVQATAPLRVGDWVMTSGLGGTYPRDLPVGRIREIRQRPVDLFQVAVLDPAADLENDRIVLAVTNFVPPAGAAETS